MFQINENDYASMLEWAQQHAPQEACGLLTGQEDGETRIAEKLYLLDNTDHSAEHFSLSPSDQLKVLLEARQEGRKVIGVWHSHPATPSRMSEEDIRLARDESRSYLILSLAEDQPVLHSFRMKDGIPEKEEIEITKGA